MIQKQHRALALYQQELCQTLKVSVSESMLNKVRDYIKSQEEHHKKMTFKSEYEKFITKFGFNHHA